MKENEISIIDLFKIVRRYIFLIIGVIAVCLILGIGYKNNFVESSYTSTGAVMLQADNNSGSISEDITLSQKLMSTLMDFIISDLVIDSAAADSHEFSQGNISINQTVSNSLILSISVTAPTAIEAQEDAIALISNCVELANSTDFEGEPVYKVLYDKISIVDTPKISSNDQSLGMVSIAVISIFLGAIVALGIIFFIEILDTKLRGSDFIENDLEATYLGSISKFTKKTEGSL